jgi:TatD DNase family protein
MYFDAHNHLHDPRLCGDHGAILAELNRLGLQRAVVNGTREIDWENVAQLARTCHWIQPSFGLHPWFVPERSAQWQTVLRRFLHEFPQAGVGEIGLDRWIEPRDEAVQRDVFLFQLGLAAELQRPASLHCIRAWGALWEILKNHPLPECGFLLHAYAGPREMIPGFVRRGAFFSFSPSFLHPRKTARREVFRHIPLDRLLVETDAPDLGPPPELDGYGLLTTDNKPLNHPGNIALAYRGLAETLGWTLQETVDQVGANFERLFGGGTVGWR